MNKAVETVLGGIEKAVLKPFGILSDNLTAPLEDNRELHKNALQSYIDNINKQEDLSPLMKAAFIDNARKTLKEYCNKRDIVQLAIEKLGDNTDDITAPSEEWLSRFFEEAKHVSKREIQEIWARILAGELQEPDSIPIRLLRVVAEMDKEQAETFSRICNYTVLVYNKIDFDRQENILDRMIICPPMIDALFSKSVEEYQDLETAGLLQERKAKSSYSFGEPFYYIISRKTSKIFFEINENYEFPSGNIMLTELGKKMIDILDIENREDYLRIDHSDQVEKYLGKSRYVKKHDISEIKEFCSACK